MADVKLVKGKIARGLDNQRKMDWNAKGMQRMLLLISYRRKQRLHQALLLPSFFNRSSTSSWTDPSRFARARTDVDK